MRVFRVSRPEYGNGGWVSRDWKTIEDCEFDGAAMGDSIVVTLAEMTQKELDALPEFEGW